MSSYQAKLTTNQNTPIYLDANLRAQISTDASLTFVANGTAGNAGTLSVSNPNPFTNNGSTLIYYNGTNQIGISTNTFDATAAVKLYVNGGINFTGSLYKNGVSYGSSWNDGTDITYTSKNVAIGNTTNPLSLLEITKDTYTGPILTLDVGSANDATLKLPRSIGNPMMKFGKGSYSSTANDYYGIGFGYAPTLTDKSCCEIGCIISNTTGNTRGNLVFSTRAETTNIAPTERMRIAYNGNVHIGWTSFTESGTPNPHKLNVNGNINITGGYYVNDVALSTGSTFTGGNITSKIICADTTWYGAPSVGTSGGAGDKIILYPGGASAYPYSIGISPGALYLSVPAGTSINSYINGVNKMWLNSGGLGVADGLWTGTLNVSGVATFANDRWNNTQDGKNRLYFVNNGRTYFGSQDGYAWRSSTETDIASLTNSGTFYATDYNWLNITGYTTFGSQINAASGTLGANQTVSTRPIGYLYWGAGEGATAVAKNIASGTAVGVYCLNTIAGQGVISFSDRRIKCNINDIPDDITPNFLKLRPVAYNKIQTAEFNYGFIAQEVQEELPEIITTGIGIVPNIFEVALSYENDIIKFQNKKDIKLKVGDVVKINDTTIPNGNNYKITEVIDNNHFKVDKKINGKDLFILGTEVDDFLSINYDYITTINTKILQDLYHQVQKQQEQINLLMQLLESRVRE